MELSGRKAQEFYAEKLKLISKSLVAALAISGVKVSVEKEIWQQPGILKQNTKTVDDDYGAVLYIYSGILIFKTEYLHINLSSGGSGNRCFVYAEDNILTPAVREIIEKMVIELRSEIDSAFQLHI